MVSKACRDVFQILPKARNLEAILLILIPKNGQSTKLISIASHHVSSCFSNSILLKYCIISRLFFISSVVWTEWTTEDPSKCKEKCCDLGGSFTHQKRNCTIIRQRCDLNECKHYGAIEREVSCKTACDCMSNAGRSLLSPRKMVQYFC